MRNTDWDNILIIGKNDPNLSMNGIKQIVNIKSKNLNSPSCPEINNTTTTDPKVICNTFNDYFVNIADKISDKRKFDGKKHFSEYLHNPNQNTFVYKLTDSVEIISIINQLSVSKASGPNRIPM